ncbi:Gfo/Idh/MocA family protein [Oceanomicrobium pacificus]|uniref:Gfo/Idh/MocA family oxidoreductase n=1 Tax=Oceanomicrobium pacificus TaxID=2692916 RepID=A0A6B0TY85_9RHOB|nr:Gfo/Idh/MocA family oxidoreductase [Oceanomicrobium pacificus]MXU66014.1 Gfo/Idh/MocA family oxidoreductase [Oceanomicrobium pacificus]
MSRKPTVLVAGTGFAGEGHTDAFRAAGAEVVGMVGRTPHVAAEVAGRLGIPMHGTDWQAALRDTRPDIVAIATPGGAHFEQIRLALGFGAHVFCDKPLTTDGARAEQLLALADAAGVKTAFAASYRYTPSVRHAQALVAAGAIGRPTEVECISHFNLERGIPFGWSHRQEAGGGRLNNNFTHTLAIVSAVLDATPEAVTGEVRDDLRRAPIVDGVHNFATRRAFIPADLSDPKLQWGKSNVEWSYTVLARMKSSFAEAPVSALFKHGGLVPRFREDHIVFYGDAGAIYLEGHYGSGALHLCGPAGDWQDLALPADIAADTPDVTGETEQCWHYLAREFMADIQGRPVAPYPTFRDGCAYQKIIDLIRANANWTDLHPD